MRLWFGVQLSKNNLNFAALRVVLTRVFKLFCRLGSRIFTFFSNFSKVQGESQHKFEKKDGTFMGNLWGMAA